MTNKYDTIPMHSFMKLYRLCNQKPWLARFDIQPALLELWNLSDTDSKRDLISDLLERFRFIESPELHLYIINIKEFIINRWNLNGNNTKIAAIADSDQPDGSQSLLQSLKAGFANLAGWSENNFINNILHAAHNCRNSEHLVIVDDFIGTGNTVDRRIKYVMRILNKRGVRDVSIYICSIAAMNVSQHIMNSLGIQHYVPIWLSKGISDFYTADLQDRINDMLGLESFLGEKYKNHQLSSFSMGYKKSEALFAIDTVSVPNNVFPIFWWPILKDNTDRNTILKRII
jgi:hypothetical protein